QPPHRPDSARALGLRARLAVLGSSRRPRLSTRRLPMFAFSWLRQLQRRWFPGRAMRRVPVRRVRLGLEALEERLTPSTYTVSDASDTAGSASDVTLRYAINQAVSNKDTNAVIGFSSALAGQTLTLSQNDSSSANIYGPTAFVVNNAAITIDGSKAPGLVL